MKDIELGKNKTEEKQILTSDQARRLFISASVNYPASVFAQSAFMLLNLRNRNVSSSVMRLLLNSPEQLEKIVSAATKIHGKKVSAYVTPEAVVHILNTEIELMTSMEVLQQRQVELILDAYSDLFRNPEEYSLLVKSLIERTVQRD